MFKLTITRVFGARNGIICYSSTFIVLILIGVSLSPRYWRTTRPKHKKILQVLLPFSEVVLKNLRIGWVFPLFALKRAHIVVSLYSPRRVTCLFLCPLYNLCFAGNIGFVEMIIVQQQFTETAFFHDGSLFHDEDSVIFLHQ